MSAASRRLVVGFVAFVLVGWAAGELWLSVVGSLDIDAVRDLAGERTPSATSAMRAVTWLGSLTVLAPVALVCCVALWRAGNARAAWAVALSLAGASLISVAVKALVARPRPPVAHLQKVAGFSFPSGHAIQCSSFALALVLALSATGVRPLVLAGAAAAAAVVVLAVATSRVYLGVHYPGDVVAGVLLGCGWAAYVARAVGGRESR